MRTDPDGGAVTTPKRKGGPDRVAVLVRHGVMPLELGLVHQLFGAARGPAGERLYEVVTCAPEPGLIRTDADFPVYAAHGPEAMATARTLVVPASHESDEALEAGALRDEPWAGHLLAAARPGSGRRVASICTGAFVLAALGLLDGRTATTHWKSASRLARTFPRVRVDPEVLYVDASVAGEGVLTSAGEAAGIDLCLHLIRADHGASVAAETARTTVVPPHREGGQAQYIPVPVPDRRDTGTAPTRAWALTRLTGPLTLRELADHASMSVRTFSRRFAAETGTTPMRWLLDRRVDHARSLLENTDDTVDGIASRSGFGTAAALRAHFQDRVGVPPSTYRTTFRGPRQDSWPGTSGAQDL